MAKITEWRVGTLTAALTAALAAGLAGLGIGLTWGNRTQSQTRAATIVPAASLAAGGGTTIQNNGITVTGSGTVSGTPDALKLAMSVQVTRPTVTEALDAANGTTAKVQTTLTQHGVDDKDLQTSGVSIQAQYSYTHDNTPTLTGYSVTENLTATLRNLKTAGATISAAAAAGGDATRINSVSLDLTNTSKLVTAARDAAFKQAKNKASQYAKVAGVSLGNVASISETMTTPESQPVTDATVGAAPTRSASPVPIRPGSQDVVVTVTVVFEIG